MAVTLLLHTGEQWREWKSRVGAGVRVLGVCRIVAGEVDSMVLTDVKSCRQGCGGDACTRCLLHASFTMLAPW